MEPVSLTLADGFFSTSAAWETRNTDDNCLKGASEEETKAQRYGGCPGRGPVWPGGGGGRSKPTALHPQGKLTGIQRMNGRCIKNFGKHCIKQNQKDVFIAGLLRAFRSGGRGACSIP